MPASEQDLADLLCGDWHTAADPVQLPAGDGLRVPRRQHQEHQGRGPRVRGALVNACQAHQRLKSTGEILADRIPEPACPRTGTGIVPVRQGAGPAASRPRSPPVRGRPGTRGAGDHTGLVDTGLRHDTGRVRHRRPPSRPLTSRAEKPIVILAGPWAIAITARAGRPHYAGSYNSGCRLPPSTRAQRNTAGRPIRASAWASGTLAIAP